VNLLGQGGSVQAQEKALIETGVLALQFAATRGEDGDIAEDRVGDYVEVARAAESVLDVVCGLSGANNTNRNSVSNAIERGDFAQANRMLTQFWLAADGPVYSHRNTRFEAGYFDDFLNR